MKKKTPYYVIGRAGVDGKFSWKFMSANGAPVAESAQRYARARDALRGINRTMKLQTEALNVYYTPGRLE